MVSTVAKVALIHSLYGWVRKILSSRQVAILSILHKSLPKMGMRIRQPLATGRISFLSLEEILTALLQIPYVLKASLVMTVSPAALIRISSLLAHMTLFLLETTQDRRPLLAELEMTRLTEVLGMTLLTVAMAGIQL